MRARKRAIHASEECSEERTEYRVLGEDPASWGVIWMVEYRDHRQFAMSVSTARAHLTLALGRLRIVTSATRKNLASLASVLKHASSSRRGRHAFAGVHAWRSITVWFPRNNGRGIAWRRETLTTNRNPEPCLGTAGDDSESATSKRCSGMQASVQGDPSFQVLQPSFSS